MKKLFIGFQVDEKVSFVINGLVPTYGLPSFYLTLKIGKNLAENLRGPFFFFEVA